MKAFFSAFAVLLMGAGCIPQGSFNVASLTGNEDAYEMHRGEADDLFEVAVYDEDEVYNGTTFFPDLSDEHAPRVVEVNMLGEVVWSYDIPVMLQKYDEPGLDVEYLPETDTVLIVLPRWGIIEVDRDGKKIWEHQDVQISHDADRLENGNTIYVWGGDDVRGDDVVKEIDPDGNLVWSWAADVYQDQFFGTYRGGWIHTNGVQRLDDRTTLVSLRNFNMTIIVDEDGDVIWEKQWDEYGKDAHEPEITDDGTLLICLQGETEYQALEMTLDGEVVWSFFEEGLRTARDCDRLENGNTLIQAVDGDEKTMLLEVTPEGEVVWRFTYAELLTEKAGLIYKAHRVRY